MQCQMMNVEMLKVCKDLEKLMTEQGDFSKLQKQAKQTEICKGLKTIVFDIERTLVTRFEIKSKHELETLKSLENFNCDYVVIDKTETQGETCC